MNKLQLIDADTLYYKPLAHPKMLIDGVLSDGLAILAGDSKIGKSWMVLWLCLQISRGEAVWGLPTRKTDVVYLALEDREWRVQQRMQELTDSPPENLRFGFSCGQLGAELEGQIEETLREFPSTGLIFIDTLQMVRDNTSAKVNAYAQDYKDLSGLKKLADDHGICIFVVHHTRKERDNSNIRSSPKRFRMLSTAQERDNLSREVLSHISFRIPQNTTTAIVGPSGSGKTTICSLLARFYDAQNGEIQVGGHNVREFTCDSLLKNISMVFQNVYLFHDSIRNNILFGKPDASEEEIIAAAKAARCHDFIMALPDGYNTVVGEGGSTLSGGEKQRISIARAMLKNAPIVILDEATASIDPENEHLIQQAIGNLTHGKTIIVIAHRLATIESADQILVIDEGKVVQRGTHQQLVSQNGLYKRFISIREQAEGWAIG